MQFLRRLSSQGSLILALLAFNGYSGTLYGQYLITTVAGSGNPGYAGDNGPAVQASFTYPSDVVFDTAGNMFIADTHNYRIRRVDAVTGVVTTVVGGGDQAIQDSLLAMNVALPWPGPTALVLDPAGNLYFVVGRDGRVFRMNAADGMIHVVASGFGDPIGIVRDVSGSLFVADNFNGNVVCVNPQTGALSTITGGISSPDHLALDGNGGLFVSARDGAQVYRVDISNGEKAVVAGTGQAGFSGDGGAATSAQLNMPAGLALDEDGNLLIADFGNYRIRLVDIHSGIITTIAGTGAGSPTSIESGPALAANILPRRLTLAVSGDIFIPDHSNQTIRKVFLRDSAPPLISEVSLAPTPLAVGNTARLSAVVDDSVAGGSSVVSAEYSVDGDAEVSMDGSFGSVRASVSAIVPPLSTGVHSICVRGTDDAGNVSRPDSACLLLPVYDPNGGFVTGGGRVMSLPTADLLNPAASGLASFGFVSKYLPGRNTPDGNLAFQFSAGNLNFKSTSMDWLVVTGGSRAQFWGTGTINGVQVCKFEVDAWDGSYKEGKTDAFGLRIFSCTGGSDRYRLAGAPLVNGSIIIHAR